MTSKHYPGRIQDRSGQTDHRASLSRGRGISQIGRFAAQPVRMDEALRHAGSGSRRIRNRLSYGVSRRNSSASPRSATSLKRPPHTWPRNPDEVRLHSRARTPVCRAQVMQRDVRSSFRILCLASHTCFSRAARSNVLLGSSSKRGWRAAESRATAKSLTTCVIWASAAAITAGR